MYSLPASAAIDRVRCVFAHLLKYYNNISYRCTSTRIAFQDDDDDDKNNITTYDEGQKKESKIKNH